MESIGFQRMNSTVFRFCWDFKARRPYCISSPFPDEKKNEYHAGWVSYFYITSGERMHVYEVRTYGYMYHNHSTRTISKNFIGTYSGIHYRNQLMPAPFPNFREE